MDKSRDNFISEINSKYSIFEEDILAKLKALNQEEKRLLVKHPNKDDEDSSRAAKKSVNLQLSASRNKLLKQDLEKTKARFRSRVTYSPLEGILEKAKDNYLKQFNTEPPSSCPKDFAATTGNFANCSI